MSIEIKVPALPESVADATIAAWHKKVGDSVQRDENILDLETDKVVLEVPATANCAIDEILFKEGDVVTAGQVLAKMSVGSAASKQSEVASKEENNEKSDDGKDNLVAGPGVRRLIAEHDLNASDITASGDGGRITKEDVAKHLSG